MWAPSFPACGKLRTAWPAKAGDGIPPKLSFLAVGPAQSCVAEQPLSVQCPEGKQAAGVPWGVPVVPWLTCSLSRCQQNVKVNVKTLLKCRLCRCAETSLVTDIPPLSHLPKKADGTFAQLLWVEITPENLNLGVTTSSNVHFLHTLPQCQPNDSPTLLKIPIVT